ncbi:MAG: recombinase family protein [Giesbergeria sp.]
MAVRADPSRRDRRGGGARRRSRGGDLREAPRVNHCIVYARVSTAEQAASGLGIAAQQAACHRLAASRDWHVLCSYIDDGVSGAVSPTERPGCRDALAHASASGVPLVVYSVSRIARTQRGLLDALARVCVVSVTEPFDATTSMGRAMLGILSVFAELERDLARERTTAALDAARARGARLGRPPVLTPEAAAEAYRAAGTVTEAARRLGVGRAAVRRALRHHA